ncbi:MAG: helix-turn-helix domain protein [Herbinix sp.]|nr:helix-turn-helix domain protein [Herbinix sp.]
MSHFESIKEALEYIDHHLDEPMNYETLAEHFHFSPYYFHRMFAIIVGKTITVHIRDRRLMQACRQLSETDKSIIHIGMDHGYNSAQSFSRAFKDVYGLSPREYREQGLIPDMVTVDEMIKKFTNRLKGGIYVNPKIIKRDTLRIAGVSGDGNKTWEVWNTFEQLNKETPLKNKLSDHGYEIRLYDGDTSTVHVGFAVSEDPVDAPYTIYQIPSSKYASFDVYVANGYDSENNAMNEWVHSNQEGYSERTLGNSHYCVEFYDERFHGSEAGSIVEIWIPIEKKKEDI